MARYVFIAHQHDDQAQVRGFILLRWNTNVGFSFFDRSLVDPVKSKDEPYIRRCIREKINGTSISIILIGDKTHESQWVAWEIEESFQRGNGVIGIRLKGKNGAQVPSLLKNRAEVINWDPRVFEEAIERAAKAAGR